MITAFPSRTIALTIGDFSIHWYGVMYLLAFLLALILLPNIQTQRRLFLTRDEWAELLSWAVLGVLIGGRLGFVLLYEPQYFAQHPRQILYVWQGGMASHGGFMGVILALLLFSWRRKVDVWNLADIVVIPAALGLALGRFGNFINQELYGTVTTLPWGVEIPGVVGLRHPTQIYAMIKDVAIAVLSYGYLCLVRPVRPGRTAALFLMLYGALRFVVEHFREQPYSSFFIGDIALTRGQLYTVPVFLFGALLWVMLPQRLSALVPDEGMTDDAADTPRVS